MKEMCMLQRWVYEEGAGWRENQIGICSGLTKSNIAEMLTEERCGTTRCPFFKPAKLGRPEEILRREINGQVVFARRY